MFNINNSSLMNNEENTISYGIMVVSIIQHLSSQFSLFTMIWYNGRDKLSITMFQSPFSMRLTKVARFENFSDSQKKPKDCLLLHLI